MENKIPDPGSMDPKDPLLEQKTLNNQVPPMPNTGVVMPGNNPQMNPFSNGTGSARPNISEVDEKNLNQFKQGVGINQNYGYGASIKPKKSDAKKGIQPADASAFFTAK